MLVRPVSKATKLLDDNLHIFLKLLLHIFWSLEFQEEDIKDVFFELELDSRKGLESFKFCNEFFYEDGVCETPVDGFLVASGNCDDFLLLDNLFDLVRNLDNCWELYQFQQ